MAFLLYTWLSSLVVGIFDRVGCDGTKVEVIGKFFLLVSSNLPIDWDTGILLVLTSKSFIEFLQYDIQYML